MSLSRAFTTKRAASKPKELDLTSTAATTPQRSLTTRPSFPSGSVRARKISAPIELLSTTNMLSYNAPDIYPRSRSSTTSSSVSTSDSRSTSSGSTSSSPSSVGTPFTSAESSSVESSPTTDKPEPNHLSCYFGNQVVEEAVPQIPTRALSHTKKSAEFLARKRSITRISSPPVSRKNSISAPFHSYTPSTSSSITRTSANMFSAMPEPFGNELAQVSELAEEFAAGDKEEAELVQRGLFKFCAEEYMSELQGLFISAFGDAPRPLAPIAAAWI